MTTVQSTADRVSHWIDQQLSERSYLGAIDGIITIPLTFQNAIDILTPGVRQAIASKLVACGYTGAWISFDGATNVLSVMSPIR